MNENIESQSQSNNPSSTTPSALEEVTLAWASATPLLSTETNSTLKFAPRNYPHTPEQIAKELRVDEEGRLWWKCSASGRRRDKPVGSRHQRLGYLRFMVLGHRYLAHVMCWALYYQEWPKGYIDHIDGNTFNNRKNNLRVVTQSENKHNPQKLYKNNTSGVHGVTYITARDNWVVGLRVNNLYVYGGSYENYEDAIEARKQLEVKHGVDKYSILTKSLNHDNHISIFQNISL